MQRAINAEAKGGLKSSTIVRGLDIHCLRGHLSFSSIALKMQTQGTTAKDSSHPEKPRAKETKSVYTDTAKPSKQNKNDKKDRSDKKRRFWERMVWNDISITGNNTINISKKKKKNWDCDTSGVEYYNCNKKAYFANTYIEQKN